MATVGVNPVDLDTPPPELGTPSVLVLYAPWPFRISGSKSSETLEWLTAVLPGFTGEQRLALRDVPRQIFNFDHTMEPHDFTRAKDYVRLRARATVPVWAERTRISGTLSAAATEIDFDTTDADYRVGGAVIVWGGPDQSVVISITDVTTTKLTLAAALGDTFVDPIVAPARVALISTGLKITRHSVNHIVCTISFLVSDNADVSADIGYPQYQSLDVLTESTLIVSSITENIIKPSEFIDSGFGPVVIEPSQDYVEFGQTLGFLEQDKAALWRRRQWLHSLKGRQKAFWLPTFMQDLVSLVTIGAVDTVITVEKIGLSAALGGRDLMIELNDGARYFRKINSAVDGGVGETYITISSSLGAIVTPDDIRLFSFLSKVRLNADRVDIKYRGIRLAEITIPITEVPA